MQPSHSNDPVAVQDSALQALQSPGLLARAVDWVFGYDFFISYNHADGRGYPRRLRDRLEQSGFRVFLDQTDYVAGQDLRRETRRQVVKSRKIVVIGRPGALRSEWVKREIDVALAHDEIPLIIDINRSVLDAPAGTLVADLARERHWLRLNESLADPDGEPSDHAVGELVRGFQHMRQETKRQRTFAAAAAVLTFATATATWQAVEARRQQAIAERNFETAKQAADALVVDIARGLRDVEGMQTESVRRILTQAQAAFDKLAAAAPDDPALLQSRIAMLNEFVETYLEKGDVAKALEDATASVKTAEHLVARRGGDRVSRRQMALALLKLGDANRELGEIGKARDAYSSGLNIRRTLASEAPDDAVARREMAVALTRLGGLEEGLSEFRTATQYYSESLTLRLELAKLRANWRRDVVVAYIVLGDAQMELSEVAEARVNFDKATSLADELHKAEPTNTKALRDLAIAQQRLGNHAVTIKDAVRARTYFKVSRATFERLSKLNPSSLEWRRDISVSDAKLAKAEELFGDKAAALALHGEVVKQRRKFLAESPLNSQLQIDLVEALKDEAALLPPLKAREQLVEARDMLRILSRNALGREQMAWLKKIEKDIAGTN